MNGIIPSCVLVLAGLTASGCSTSDSPPAIEIDGGGSSRPDARAPDPRGETEAGVQDAGGDADAGAGDSGVGCPKTSCDTYAARAHACDGTKGIETWKNVCSNAASKCVGASIPDCFCAGASACDELRWCYLAPCEQ